MSDPEEEQLRTIRTEPDRDPASEVLTGYRRFLLPVVVFLLAAGFRTLSIRSVFREDGVVFFDGDSYYHLWRIWNAATKSIPLSAPDPFVNFPRGGEILWPPAFDWIIAKAIETLALDLHSAESLGACLPVLLGAGAVVIAAQIASRSFSRQAGWITGIILAILPGSFNYTQIGFFDHHAAIALIGTALLGGAMHIVDGDRCRSWISPLLGGLLCAFALWVWTGAQIHIGILQVAMIVWAMSADGQNRAVQRTFGLALAHLVIAIAIWPISTRVWEHYGDFSPLAPTRFQPIYYASAAVCLAVAAMTWRGSAIGHTRFQRFASGGVIGLLALGIAFATIPGLASALSEGAGWFSGDSQFLSIIHELQPLFGNVDAIDWQQPIETLSPLVICFPIALVAVVWRAERPSRWLLALWAAGFCALTLSQVRFINTFSVALAIVSGGAFSVAMDALPLSVRSGRRTALSSAIGLILLLIVAGSSASYYEQVVAMNSASPRVMRQDAYRAASRWLAETNPVPLGESGVPLQGLLCPWTLGHEIRYYSGWAINVDGFGPYVSPENIELVRRYFRSADESEAVGVLETLSTRYVIADIPDISQRPRSRVSMRSRLTLMNGSGREATIGSTGKEFWIPALTRHRLVFEAPHTGDDVWLYEIVNGAEIVGAAEPGSIVEVELRLRSSSGRSLRWIDRQTVDASGDFRLRVPYATSHSSSSAIQAEGAYELRTSRGDSMIKVSESAIRTGAAIEAPPNPR
jgi:dolichyl-diphosphooligosaccharide--protein glycosyltransferase